MTPAQECEPGFSVLLPEEIVQPPAEAVLFALRTIRAELTEKSQYSAKTACVPFPSGRPKRYRLLTIAEAGLKMRQIAAFSEVDPLWAQQVANELYRETRNEQRMPKAAPVLDRFADLVRKIVSDHGGAWTTLPTLASIAKTFAVSVRSVQTALNQLRETSSEFAFHVEPRLDSVCQSRRGRCVRVALTCWLKYDLKPLLFDLEGHERGLRTSFRPDGLLLTPGSDKEPDQAPVNHANGDCEEEVSAIKNQEPDEPAASLEPLTNCKMCLSDSIRLFEPAVIFPNPPLDKHPQIGQRRAAPPELKSSCRNSKSANRQAWGLARNLHNCHFGDWVGDEDLSYHRWRFELPVHVVQNIIGEALEAQVKAPKVATLFESACYETNAAVFDGLARNPGGLFRSVFRRRWQNGHRPTTVAPAIGCSPAKEPLVKEGLGRREEARCQETPEEADKRKVKLAADFKIWRLSFGK
jgi:hypothetical protein